MPAKSQSLEHSGGRRFALASATSPAGATSPAMAKFLAIALVAIIGVLLSLSIRAQTNGQTLPAGAPQAQAPPTQGPHPQTLHTQAPERQTMLARSGRYAYPEATLRDVLAIDAAILESPLSAAEQAQIRALVIEEFNRDPAKIVAVIPATHRMAELFHSGPGYDIASTREKYWESAFKLAQSDTITARWLEIMKRHVPVIVAANGYVVTMHQVNALFSSSDYIAAIADQPRSTPEQRAAEQVRRRRRI